MDEDLGVPRSLGAVDGGVQELGEGVEAGRRGLAYGPEHAVVDLVAHL